MLVLVNAVLFLRLLAATCGAPVVGVASNSVQEPIPRCTACISHTDFDSHDPAEMKLWEGRPGSTACGSTFAVNQDINKNVGEKRGEKSRGDGNPNECLGCIEISADQANNQASFWSRKHQTVDAKEDSSPSPLVQGGQTRSGNDDAWNEPEVGKRDAGQPLSRKAALGARATPSTTTLDFKTTIGMTSTTILTVFQPGPSHTVFTTVSANKTSLSTSGGSGHLTAGSIVGIAIGAIISVLAAAAIVVLIRRRIRRRNAPSINWLPISNGLIRLHSSDTYEMDGKEDTTSVKSEEIRRWRLSPLIKHWV